MRRGACCAAGFYWAEYAQGLAEHDGLGHLAAGAAEDAVEGLARNAQARRGFEAVEILVVGEAERLGFVGAKFDLAQFAQRDAGRLEIVCGRSVADPTGAEGAGHGGWVENLCSEGTRLGQAGSVGLTADAGGGAD